MPHLRRTPLVLSADVARARRGGMSGPSSPHQGQRGSWTLADQKPRQPAFAVMARARPTRWAHRLLRHRAWVELARPDTERQFPDHALQAHSDGSCRCSSLHGRHLLPRYHEADCYRGLPEPARGHVPCPPQPARLDFWPMCPMGPRNRGAGVFSPLRVARSPLPRSVRPLPPLHMDRDRRRNPHQDQPSNDLNHGACFHDRSALHRWAQLTSANEGTG